MENAGICKIILLCIDVFCEQHNQRSGFDSRLYQVSWEIVGLERGPFSVVSTIEELFGRRSSGSRQEIRDYGRRDPPR
jgi:hypothetical protein